MTIGKAALAGVITVFMSPALADPMLVEPPRKLKKLTTIEVCQTAVDVIAVTRRARADTDFHRQFIDESMALNKVYPGYPKPAYVSFDLRLQF